MNETMMVQELARLRTKLDSTRSVFTAVPRDMEIAVLARKASEKLGYSVLEEKYLLRNALAKIEIDVLDTQVVEEYKDLARRMKNGYRFWQPWNWHLQRIGNFSKPIPEFVLNKAIQIKEEISRAKLFVDVLTKDESEFFYPDPFLVASLGEYYDKNAERYYVEVWDEHIFEGRLTK